MGIRQDINDFLAKFEHQFITYNRIEVSKQALLNNFDFFKLSSAGSMQIIPVLKANAYGHGISLVAESLNERIFPYFAVDGYFEALRIRRVSDKPVLIMGAIAPENYTRIKFDNFAFVVDELVTIDALGRTGKRVKVHLECNSGMNRRGAKIGEIRQLTRRILSYPNLELEGIMSHLADSDGDDPGTVDEATAVFDACVEEVIACGCQPALIHLAQTAGSLKAKSRYANCMRLGIGLYGINPFGPKHKLHSELEPLIPALKLVSTITKIINLSKGEKVSYNYTFTANRPMKIGVLPLGYYEGVNRQLSNAGLVKVKTEFTPIIGRVCMNHTIISLENLNTKIGDAVVIYSDNPDDPNSIDQLASKFGLFNYNLLTALSPDVRRVLV